MTDLQLKDTRGIDPKWIDLDTLRKWLKTCDTEHSGHCKIPPWSAASGPQWLIDVDNLCLVRAHEDCSYAALSYVWGQVETLTTTKDNLSFLQEPMSLKAHHDYLSRVIKDTMQLVSLLGIDYLWVDCLCIVQDDEESLQHEIDRMGDIYQNAYVVVAAANGWDANHGLRGVHNVTEPRSLAVSDLRDLRGDTWSLNGRSTKPFWYTRGWTFQEMVLARRLIVFHYQFVLWHCAHDARHEFSDDKSSISKEHRQMFGRMCREVDKFIFHPWPNVRQFMDHVNHYNRRTLSYPEDALRAFSGLLSAWNPSFDGGFICGLPQMFFDDALLWQGNTALNRRRHSGGPSQDPFFPPSWSWVGWQGEIDTMRWALKWDYLESQPRDAEDAKPFWKLESTVQWSYGTQEDSESRRNIDVSSHRFKHLPANPKAPLPRGWSVSGQGIDAKYCHQQFPGVRMKYPIPITSSLAPEAPMWKPEDGCLLFGQTRSGVFSALHLPEIGSWTAIGIDGEPLGYLLVDEHAEIELSNLNLVEVSAGSVWQTPVPGQPFNSVARVDRTLDPERFAKYHFFNVLWVEWQDGIAYRKGIGHVEREAWEQSTDWIDLVLG